MDDFDLRSANEIDLRTIRLVQAIDRGGSLSRAATLLGISQPAISQHLRRAEDRLGLRLVDRSERSVRLSEAGRAVLSVAEPVSQSLRFVSERLEEIRALGSGRLRMTGFAAVSRLMPRLLRSMTAAEPNAAIGYDEKDPLAALESVTAGDHDLAVIYRYAASPLSADWLAEDELHVRPLLLDELYCALGPGHPLIDAEHLGLSDLRDDEWALPSGPEGAAVTTVCRAVGFTPSASFASDSVAARLAVVQERGSVTVVARFDLHGLPVPRDVVLRRLSSRPTREICAVSSALHHEIPLVQTVVSELRALQIGNWPLHSAGTHHRAT